MNSLNDIITRIGKQIEASKPTPPPVSDEAVARMFERIARKHGYIPSPSIVEPVRDFLAGYGLLLTGKTGIGKTFLMRCLGVRVCITDEIADYGLRQIHLWHEQYDGFEVCIDDLGCERIVSEYGTKDDLLKAVIAHRSEKQRGRTHFTTNLSAEALAERYGDRTLSRIMGMCRTHRLEGAHRREPRPHLRGIESSST